jgi:hypothetical protein
MDHKHDEKEYDFERNGGAGLGHYSTPHVAFGSKHLMTFSFAHRLNLPSYKRQQSAMREDHEEGKTRGTTERSK